MVHYRRNRVPGGSYFFTVTLHDRRSDLLVQHIDILRKSFAAVMVARPFIIDAIVVMPEHLHAIWTLPPKDADYPGRWRAIKAHFTQRLRQHAMSPGARPGNHVFGNIRCGMTPTFSVMWITSTTTRSNMAMSP